MTQPAVLTVECPTCSAQPGEGCLTRSGANTGPHSARRTAVAVAVADPDDSRPEAAAEPSPFTTALADLPETLTSGLTVWGDYGGAQIRLEPRIALDDDGNPALDDDGAPVLIDAPPIGALYLALNAAAYAGHEGATEPAADGTGATPGLPVYRLDRAAARALRDLLNIATARGTL